MLPISFPHFWRWYYNNLCLTNEETEAQKREESWPRQVAEPGLGNKPFARPRWRPRVWGPGLHLGAGVAPLTHLLGVSFSDAPCEQWQGWWWSYGLIRALTSLLRPMRVAQGLETTVTVPSGSSEKLTECVLPCAAECCSLYNLQGNKSSKCSIKQSS